MYSCVYFYSDNASPFYWFPENRATLSIADLPHHFRLVAIESVDNHKIRFFYKFIGGLNKLYQDGFISHYNYKSCQRGKFASFGQYGGMYTVMKH